MSDVFSVLEAPESATGENAGKKVAEATAPHEEKPADDIFGADQGLFPGLDLLVCPPDSSGSSTL